MLDEKQQYAETVTNYATSAQYLGGGGALIFGLNLNEVGVVVGILVGVLGFFVNVYYRHRAQLMLEKKHEVELEILRQNKITYFKSEE